MSTDTAWIVEGAEVVYYLSSGVRGPQNIRRTTITKVNAKTFRIDGRDERFPVEPRPSISTRFDAQIVVPADSDEAQRLLAERLRDESASRVWSAYQSWKRAGTLAHTIALREVVESYETLLRRTIR